MNRRVKTTIVCQQATWHRKGDGYGLDFITREVWVELRYYFNGEPGMYYMTDGATSTEAIRRAARGIRGQLANMITGARPEGVDW